MKFCATTLALSASWPLAHGFLSSFPAAGKSPNVRTLGAAGGGNPSTGRSAPAPLDMGSSALSAASAAMGAATSGGAAAGASRGEDAGDVAAMVKELKFLDSRNMYHKCLRKYKNMRKAGHKPDEEGYLAVLSACVKGKVGAVADKIILDMVADKAVGELKPFPVKRALEACALGSRPVEALNVLEAAEANGVAVDLEGYTFAMRACLQAPNALPIEDLARGVMRKVRQAGPEVKLGGEYYGLLLRVLCRVKRFKEAIACFDLLCLDTSYPPRSEEYMAVMKAAAAMKDEELVKSLLGEVLMDEGRFESQYGAIMQIAAKAMANANNYRLAVKLLEKVPADERSDDLFHSVVASCARNKNSPLAVELFERMQVEGHRPKRATYNAVLHACSAAGDVAVARKVLEDMTGEGVRLNVVTYNIALNSRAKAGDARGAVNLLSEMEQAGIQPSVVSFATAVNAAAAFNSSSLAVTLMDAMKPAGLVPNAYVFTAALAACENDPDDTSAAQAAQRIVDTMAAVGAQKAMGAEMVARIGKQAAALLKRDLGVRDLEHLASDSKVLGVSLIGRQTEI